MDATEPLLAGFEERWMTFRGARVRYFVGGNGPPLVLVHGLGGAASNWVELAPALARSHRVLALDLPGHGGSSPPTAGPGPTPPAPLGGAGAARGGGAPAGGRRPPPPRPGGPSGARALPSPRARGRTRSHGSGRGRDRVRAATARAAPHRPGLRPPRDRRAARRMSRGDRGASGLAVSGSAAHLELLPHAGGERFEAPD